MDGNRSLPARLLPPPGLPRVIAFQSAMLAIGSGAFLTGGIVFFLQVIGLSPLQIGIGYSIAGVTSLATSLPLGALADRLGGRRAWVVGAAATAVSFAGYALVRSFAGFVLLMILTTAAETLAGAGRTMYTADAIPAEGRVRTMAYARSYLNVGFAAGTGVGALALALDSTGALIGLVLANAALLAVNALVVARLPAALADRSAPTQRVRRPQLAVLRDGPYVVLSVLVAVTMWHAVVLIEIVPLWVITFTDAPKPVLGALFALNTALVVLLQVPATRGTDSLPGTARPLRRAGLTAALACPVALLSGVTHGWWTVAALVGVVVLATSSELWLSAAQWYYQTNVPPPAVRGAYLGMGRMIGSISDMVAPAGLTLLAIQTGGWGWWVLAGLFLACALAARPVVAWVGRTPRVDEPTPHRPPAAVPVPEAAG